MISEHTAHQTSIFIDRIESRNGGFPCRRPGKRISECKKDFRMVLSPGKRTSDPENLTFWDTLPPKDVRPVGAKVKKH